MIGVYVAGKSGGHLNPAVTFVNCLYRGHPWRKFPVYAAGQVLGAMAGAFVVYGNYRLAIDEFEGGSGIRTVTGPTATAGIFCTYPAEFMDTTAMFWSEVISSSILIFCIFAFVDKDNIHAGPMLPLALFFLIFGIGACWGWLTGYAINLARDFGPRLVTYILGYGTEVWSAGNYYFWVRSNRVLIHDDMRLTMVMRRFPWWPPSSAAPLAVSCTTSSSTPARAPSTRRGWASSVSPSSTAARGPTRTGTSPRSTRTRRFDPPKARRTNKESCRQESRACGKKRLVA